MNGLRMWKRGVGLFLASLLILLSAALWGCQRTGGEKEGEESGSYTLPEIMLIAATERNRYEQVYTSQIWTAVVDESGTTMKDLLLEQIRTFLEDLETMNQLAEAQGIEIDPVEKDQLYQLSREFYQGLTDGDKEFIGISEKEVQALYERYFLANKVVSELTKDVDLEISDSEAKVIQVQQIVTESMDMAWIAYAQVIAEGADFASVARTNSIDPVVSRTLAKGEETESYEEAAFALEEGQISQIVESDGRFYIIKCTDPFDEEATLERKSQLSLARKEQAFRGIYDEFQAEHPAEVPDSLWSQVRFEGGEDCETSNFFDLYRKYFPE